MLDFIRKYKKNFFLVLLLGFLVYFFILFKNDASEIMSRIKDINIYYLLLVLGLFIIYTSLESWVLHLFIVYKLKGFNYNDSFRLNLSTQFFNAITPFSSGGQPFQIFYFKTRGVKVKDSTSIVLMNFITFTIAFDIVGIVSLIFKYQYFNQISGHGYLLLIGFGVNIFITVLTFILAFSKKIYHIIIEVIWLKMVHWAILRRFRLDQKTEKIRQTVDDFNQEIKELNNHKLLWVQSVLLHVIRIVIVYSIPFFLFLALGEPVQEHYVNLIIGAFFVAMVMSYIPSPGASGGAEGLFILFFTPFFSSSTIILSTLLLWRFITYYLYLLLGFIALFRLNYKKNLEEINYPE